MKDNERLSVVSNDFVISLQFYDLKTIAILYRKIPVFTSAFKLETANVQNLSTISNFHGYR